MSKLNATAEAQIREICDRYKGEKTPLMMILSDIQNEYGYIPLEVQEVVSEKTGISVAEIYGVVTFYSFFSLTPKGKYVIGCCLGTACYVKGAQIVIDRFSELLGIKPVLRIYGEKLDAFAKAHGMKNAKKVMIKAITDDLEKNYGGIDPDKPNVWLGMAYTHNLSEAEEFKAEVQEAFPNYHIDMYPLSLSISCHIGPGALAVTCTGMLPDGVQVRR